MRLANIRTVSPGNEAGVALPEVVHTKSPRGRFEGVTSAGTGSSRAEGAEKCQERSAGTSGGL